MIRLHVAKGNGIICGEIDTRTSCESWFVYEVSMKPISGNAFGNAGSGVPGSGLKPGMFTTPLFGVDQPLRGRRVGHAGDQALHLVCQ